MTRCHTLVTSREVKHCQSLLKNKEESRLDVSRRVRKGVGFKRECDAASVETVKLPSDEELALEKQDFNLFTVMS